MLSVCFVTPYFAPAWEYGGIPRATYDLACGLTKAGVAVYVITTDAYSRYYRAPALNCWSSEDGIQVFRLANLSNRLVYNAGLPVPVGGLAALASQLPPVDIIHLHGHRHLLNHLVVEVLYRKRVPFVFSGHGSVPAHEGKITMKRVYDSLFGRRILEDARLYFAVSKVELLHLRAAGMREPKIRVIYNPVPKPPESVFKRRGFFRADWKIPFDARVIMFLGKITPRKGVDILLRAMPLLQTQNYRLVIAGNALGHSGLTPYQKLAEALEVSDKVIFTDHIVPGERFHALIDADVLAYPARDEIFGLAAAEALMVGTPVVAADDSGLAEILRLTGGSELVPYGDTQALADKLDYVLAESKDKLQVSLGKAAQWIEENLNTEKIIAQLLDAYHDVLG